MHFLSVREEISAKKQLLKSNIQNDPPPPLEKVLPMPLYQ